MKISKISLFDVTLPAVLLAIIASLIMGVSVSYAVGTFAVGYVLVFCRVLFYVVGFMLFYKSKPGLNIILPEGDAVNAVCKKNVKWFTAVNIISLAVLAYQFM